MSNSLKYQTIVDISFGVDYHPMGSDYIFRVSDHLRAKKLGLPTYGIPIYSLTENHIIGYLTETNEIISA